MDDHAPSRPFAKRPPAKPALNIQDSFLFSHLKSNTDIEVIPVAGEPFKGRVVRFDRYMVVFVSNGRTMPLYKQAIAAIVGAPAHSLR